MTPLAVWLLVGLAVYIAYCVWLGIACATQAAGPRSFFLADRNLPPWVFVLAGTGASFSGWVFLGHPDIVARVGFPFAAASLGAVTIPLGGMLVMKRQWMLGRRYGYVTPAEMLGEYYASDFLRLLVLLVALVFAVPFAGMQIGAAGSLLAFLSGGAIDRVAAIWLLGGVLLVYVGFGGLRAAAYAGALQALLLGAGIIAAGTFVYVAAGGFAGFNAALGHLSGGRPGTPSPFIVPGVLRFTRGLGVQVPAGGAWTASMILSYCLALMGLQLAPAFGLLGMAARSPRGFAAQQTWASAGAMGAVLVLFLVAIGFAPRILPDLPPEAASGGAVASVLAAIGGHAPWLAALLAVCAVAAVQGLAALQLSATSTMLVRDLYRRHVDPALDIPGQRRAARIVMALLLAVTLLLASFAPESQAVLGALALGFAVQMLPALVGLCWWRWITREAAMVGFAAGLLAVVFTEPFGLQLAAFLGVHLPWGRWPWTLHSAGWGLVVNVAACVVITLISQRADETARRGAFHDFLQSHDPQPESRQHLRPVAWSLTLAWLFFAVGPGVVLGNTAFGNPRGGQESWAFGIPPLWTWQIGGWMAGVLLLWFLGSRMGFATRPAGRIEMLPRSQRPRPRAVPLGGEAALRWFWTVTLAAAIAVFANWAFG